jgi:hypothetical protein
VSISGKELKKRKEEIVKAAEAKRKAKAKKIKRDNYRDRSYKHDPTEKYEEWLPRCDSCDLGGHPDDWLS